jgi:hypothetical protein
MMSTPESSIVFLSPIAGSNSLFSEASSEMALVLGRSQDLDLSSLAGIPILPPMQQSFKDAIKTWSIHEKILAVFRPETEADILIIINRAREGGCRKAVV